MARTYLYARWLCFSIAFFGRNDQGPRSKFSSGGGYRRMREGNFLGGPGGGGHACGFLLNFSKVTENANNDKPIDFFPHLQ